MRGLYKLRSSAGYVYAATNKNIMPFGRMVRWRSPTMYKRRFSSCGFTYSEEVAQALSESKPLVALESTIITHGLPYPQNYEIAKAVEDVVRKGGATPATIAIIKGQVHVGLTDEQISYLADPSLKVLKTSRHNLPMVLSEKGNGSTTVASTMIIAHRAGIKVFVTGGIGGVHRGAESTMDISADLSELGKTPVAVVCAGAKSILDIPRTLEYLETQGVGVLTYGKTKDFPAFYCRSSMSPVTNKSNLSTMFCDNPIDIANMIEINHQLNLNSGMVIGVPIPEKDELDPIWIHSMIENALEEAEDNNIFGAAVTPFLLDKLSKLTEGKSIHANKSLILNNAEKGTKIACSLAQLKTDIPVNIESYKNNNMDSTGKANNNAIIIGSTNYDIIAKCQNNNDLVLHTSNPGSVQFSFGGVGRNITACAAQLDNKESTTFLSCCGDDLYGSLIHDHLSKLHVNLKGFKQLPNISTSIYCAILDQNSDLSVAIGDCLSADYITKEYLSSHAQDLSRASIVCVDGNIPAESIKYICDLCWANNVPVWFEPTSVGKCTKPIETDCLSKLSYISPNTQELSAMIRLQDELICDKSILASAKHFTKRVLEKLQNHDVCLDKIVDKWTIENGIFMSCFCPNVILTLGEKGLLVFVKLQHQYKIVWMRSKYEVSPEEIKDVTGAGDSLVGGMIHGLKEKIPIEQSMELGMACALLTLKSYSSVSEIISFENAQELADKAFKKQIIEIAL